MKALKNRFGLLVMFIVIASLAAAAGEFSATSPIYANWSNSYSAVIVLINSTNNSVVDVQNATSNIMNSAFGRAPFFVSPTNSTITLPANITINFTISGLAPGRYSGIIAVTNSTNSSEYVNVSTTLDVPINLTGGTGTFAGNISNSTEIYYFNASAFGNAAGLKVNLTGLSSPVTITLKDSGGTAKPPQNTPGDLIYMFATNATNWRVPNEYWSIEVSNTTGSTTFTGTLELRNASFIVNGSVNTSTVSLTENVNRAPLYKSATVTLMNYNNSDLIIYNVVNSSFLNRSGSGAAYWMNFTTNLTSQSYPLTVSGLSNLVFDINVSVDSNTTQNQSGTYTGWLYINTTNGYPWQVHNMTISVNYTTTLNVNVVSVLNQSDRSSYTVPGSIMNATLAVTYQDGTDAGLVNTSDTMLVLGWMNFSGDSTAPTSFVQTFTYVNFSKSVNYYFVNYTLPSAMPGGNYTMSFAPAKGSNGGTGTFNYSYVNESGMTVNMRTVAAAQNISDYNGTVFLISATVSNIGGKNATNVTIRLNPSNCVSIISGGLTTSATYYIGPMAPGNVSFSIPDIWKVQLAPTATSCTISVKGESPAGVWAANDTMSVVVNMQSSGSPGPSGNDPPNMVAGNNTGTTVPQVDLDIISWPKHISIVQGGSQEVEIKIKNSGTMSVQNVETKVEGTGIEAGWWKGTTLTSLGAGQNFTLPVKFTIPVTATVKNYSIFYVATSSNATARMPADLAVLPNENTKKEINNTLVNLTARYDELFKKIEDAVNTGRNMTMANETLGEAKSLITQAGSFASAGDWLNVNVLLSQIESALNNAESKIKLATGESETLGGETPTYLAAAAAVAIAVGAAAIWFAKGRGKAGTGFNIPLHFGHARARPSAAARPAAAGRKDGAFSRFKERLKKIKPSGRKKYVFHYQPE